MKIIAVGLLALLSIATIPNIQIKTDEKTTPIHQETVLAVETSTEPPEKETPVKEPENESEPKLDPIKDNPNKCNLETHHVWEDFTCHEKPKKTTPTQSQTTTTPTASSAISGTAGQAAEFYLSQGFTREATAALLGTIQQESNFAHNGRCGDGGLACGLFQWHPGRRADMPNTFHGQLAFSVREMDRDSPGTSAILKSSNSHWEVRSAIKSWIRWGHEGARWTYADQYYRSI